MGEAFTDHPAGRWHYVAALAEHESARAPVTVSVDELDGATGSHLACRFGTDDIRPLDDGHPLELAPGREAFDLWTVAPTLLDGHVTVFGDMSKYTAAGDRRVGQITEAEGGVSFLVLGVPGTTVTVTGWCGTATGLSSAQLAPRRDGDARAERSRRRGWSLDIVGGGGAQQLDSACSSPSGRTRT